jgi:hypothetical protein
VIGSRERPAHGLNSASLDSDLSHRRRDDGTEPVDAAAAQREARKKAAKEAREAESARVRAVLFPGADDQKNFEAKTKVPLTLRSASTRSASRTGGRPTAGNPP